MGLGKTIVYGTLGALVIGALGVGGFISHEYADYPFPFTKSTEMGRTKNSISTVIGAEVARQLYPNSNINLEIKKAYWSNAHVTGYATENSVATDVNDLTFTDVHYRAEKTSEELLKGKIDKSEFDWDVDQTGKGQYHIHRFAFKFNSDLEIKAQNGQISGKYFRHGPAWNWSISGTYDKNGNVNMHVNVPVGLDFDLEGKITQR